MSEDTKQGHVSTSDEVEAAPVVAKRAAPRKAPAKKAPAKRVRRTKAQIEADELADLRRQLEIAQAKLALQSVEQTNVQVNVAAPAKKAGGETRIYHIVEDGFTTMGKTWYRGQEIVIKPGSKEEEEVTDREGNFLFDLTERQQMLRWDGTVFFRPGPWPGLPFDLDNIYESDQVDEHGKPVVPSEAEVAALRKANQALYQS